MWIAFYTPESHSFKLVSPHFLNWVPLASATPTLIWKRMSVRRRWCEGAFLVNVFHALLFPDYLDLRVWCFSLGKWFWLLFGSFSNFRVFWTGRDVAEPRNQSTKFHLKIGVGQSMKGFQNVKSQISTVSPPLLGACDMLQFHCPKQL